MSPSRFPTVAAAMPRASAAWVTSMSLRASVEILPTGTVIAASACHPSTIAPARPGPCLVALDHRLGLRRVHAEPPGDDLRRVVGQAFGAGPIEDPANELVARRFEQQHPPDRPAALGEERLEGLGLRDRPRESVEHDPGGGGEAVDELADHVDRHVVRDVLPTIHVALGELAERRRALQMVAAQIAGGEPDPAVAL